MAKVKLIFYGTGTTTYGEDEIECHIDENINEIVISLNNDCIFLDKSTAIKFAKTLRTEINKIADENPF